MEFSLEISAVSQLSVIWDFFLTKSYSIPTFAILLVAEQVAELMRLSEVLSIN